MYIRTHVHTQFGVLRTYTFMRKLVFCRILKCLSPTDFALGDVAFAVRFSQIGQTVTQVGGAGRTTAGGGATVRQTNMTMATLDGLMQGDAAAR